MTMIALSKPVQVPVGDGRFVEAKAGQKVNYSCHRRENNWVHQFSFWDFTYQRILQYMEVSQDTRPGWM